MTPETVEKMVKMLVEMGHASTLEHVSFTFGIEGVSRTLTHQLVRHRIASYSQQSQRYVKEHNFESIMPPAIAAIPEDSENAEELSEWLYDYSMKINPNDAFCGIDEGLRKKVAEISGDCGNGDK